jgi:PadR family transcriptional regulator AphA
MTNRGQYARLEEYGNLGNMTTDETRLSLTDWVVLGLVAEQPRHGFAVARELAPSASLGRVWTVHRPLVYRALQHLTAAGLLESVRTERGLQGPERTVLRATRIGRARLRRWLEEPVDHFRDVRVELLVKFTLLARSHKPLDLLASRQLDQFAPLVATLRQQAAEAVGADRVVAIWRAESSRAVTRTLEAVIATEPREGELRHAFEHA